MGWTWEARERGWRNSATTRRQVQEADDAFLRPYLERAVRLGLRGDGICQYLESERLTAPGDAAGKWNRMAVRRIMRRLGMV